jgi:hypothetical protein
MTTRILFWNVQRLGAATDIDRKNSLKIYCAEYKADVELFCELTTAAAYPNPRNFTHRKENASQLCYGALQGGVDVAGMQQVEMPVPASYPRNQFGGSSDFKLLSHRALAYVGPFGGGDVYLFHAPAYLEGAARSVTYAACALDAHYGAAGHWLLIGDLNIEPDVLEQVLVTINLNGLIRSSGLKTYDDTKEYDYALSNIPGLKVGRAGRSLRVMGSDHYPIVAMW